MLARHPALRSDRYIANVMSLRPIRFYRCNESSGTILTDLMRTADATITGTPTARAVSGPAGVPGGAAIKWANATNAYALAGNAAPPSTAYTLACWQIASSYVNSGLWGRWSTNSGAMLFQEVGGGTNGIHQGTVLSYSTGTVNNRWYHLAMTWDGSNLRLYRDGVLRVGPTANSTAPGTTAANWHIGSYYVAGSLNGKSPNGSTEDCLLFDRALTAGEMSFLYRAGA